MDTRYLTVQNVIQIHILMMSEYGDGEQVGVKEMGLLESAVNRPSQSIFGEDAYPTLYEKASALFESLCRNHCFYNGNKRTAFVATDIFLKKNGLAISVDLETGETFTLNVAQGKLTKEDMTQWFEQHCKPY